MVAQHHGIGLGASFQGNDLLCALVNRVTHVGQASAQANREGAQALALLVAVTKHGQRCSMTGDFMRQQAGAEDVGKAGAQDVVTQWRRRGKKSSATSESLGQAGSDEVHAPRKPQLCTQASAVRTVRTQGMGFVDHYHAAMLLGDVHHLAQRAQGPRGAVHRIHHHHALAVARQHAVQVRRVIVAKGVCWSACRVCALPQ